MRIYKPLLLAVLSLLLAFSPSLCKAEDELYLSDIPLVPTVLIDLPLSRQTYEKGSSLKVSARGVNVSRMEAVLTYVDAFGASQQLIATHDGDEIEHTFLLDKMSSPSTLLVTGTTVDKNGNTVSGSLSRRVLSPKEQLIDRMIALAQKNSKEKKYKFAPAESDSDIGVCKNFVMRLFDTFSTDYRMREYPDLKLHMPKNNSKINCAPYDYGIEWRPETAVDGSPFEIVYQFKYDNDLTKEENAALARDMMHMVQKGDFFQMVGYYGGGNGPHSLFFIADYDPADDMLHWTDSNMRGTRIDGIRWGYMQFDADATAEWYVNVFNMKKRGATLYRLRDDLYLP